MGNVLFFITALMMLAIDQLSKTWVRTFPKGEPILDFGFLRFVYSENTGAAFGLFQEYSIILAIIRTLSIIAILVFVLHYSRRLPFLDTTVSKLSLGLVLGGTTGNLLDLLRLGAVTDFIDFGLWPSFNLADSAITVGVITFVYYLLFVVKVHKREPS